jgi:hypothetical protein
MRLIYLHPKKKKKKGKQETNGKDEEACFKNFNGICKEDKFQIGLE